MSSLHGKISADEEVLDLGEDGFEVPQGFQRWTLSPGGAQARPHILPSCSQKYMPEDEVLLSDQKEKLGKPDAELNIPQFSQVKCAAQFNMLVPNEGFPHTLQGTIILLLMSMC